MGFITKAVRINNANQIADGVITGTKLANDTITADKIGVLDYIRSALYDVYNDAKTNVKARIEHDDATNYSRFLVGADVASLDSVFNILSSLGSSDFGFGTKVSLVNMNNKRLISLSAPSSAGDALRFGNAEITNNEISPLANISRNKLAVGAPQRASGNIITNGSGTYDITGLITPTSYPALVIGYAELTAFTNADSCSLYIRDQANNILEANTYATINDSGVNESISNGVSNLISALVTAGSVKLSHNHAPLQSDQVINGTLLVIEI